jgi:hypothetical protein
MESAVTPVMSWQWIRQALQLPQCAAAALDNGQAHQALRVQRPAADPSVASFIPFIPFCTPCCAASAPSLAATASCKPAKLLVVSCAASSR